MGGKHGPGTPWIRHCASLYSTSHVDFSWFTDEKVFTVAAP